MSSNQDFERIVLEDLRNRGQMGFRITTNSWTIGTNVRTIVVERDNLTITYTIDNNSGEILDRSKSRAYFAEIVESPVLVNDWLLRTVRGIRTRKNKFALLALIVISSFEIFVILSNNDVLTLTIHLFISILVFISGYLAFGRTLDILRNTSRPMSNQLLQQSRNQVIRRCNNCRTKYHNHPCPNCGSQDSMILGQVDEIETIIETNVTAKKKYFTKINYYGLGFFIFSIILQINFSYFVGGVINLTNSSLMALILFIPSYYLFLEIIFTDIETLIKN